jgi:Holliday junction resolvase
MRYRGVRRDANHKAIADALRAAGCTVVDLAAVGTAVPDLLVGVRGRNLLLEVKNPARRTRGDNSAGTLEKQAEWRANWLGQAAVVYTIEEALHQVGCV